MKTIPHADQVRRSRTTVLMPLLWLCAGIGLGFLIRSLYERSQSEPTGPHSPFSRSRPVIPVHASAQAAATRSAAPLDELQGIFGGVSEPADVDLSIVVPLIRQLELSECEPALQLIRRTESAENYVLETALARRWAELDPVHALATAQAERQNGGWRNRLGRAAGIE